MRYLSAADVVQVHDDVIHPHELQGEAAGKSISSVIGRIETRLSYGLIDDVFSLAACYGASIAIAHAFNDANKRTAFACMDTVLAINGIELTYPDTETAGDWMRHIVLGQRDENDLAKWLRELHSTTQ
ncbi:MAG TPA: type II toxin-antitoxin system death-on-curing family toxin [Thiolinea sp.]|nr:type II toxin-antitoxin system death-on-curing family toxin [Thiolinea sp.]